MAEIQGGMGIEFGSSTSSCREIWGDMAEMQGGKGIELGSSTSSWLGLGLGLGLG